MGKGIFITGTGTEIGKTYVTKYLTKALIHKGIKAIPYKPIQTGCVWKNGSLVAEDVEQYIQTAGLSYEQKDLCTYFFEKPASPHLAAQLENTKIDLSFIKQHFEKLQAEHDLILVEGAGGLAVPVKEDNELIMTSDLIKLLNIPILVVVPPHLGSINHTLLTIDYAKAKGLSVIGIVFNKVSKNPDIVEKDNMRIIEKITKLPILGKVPFEEKEDGKQWFEIDELIKLIEKYQLQLY